MEIILTYEYVKREIDKLGYSKNFSIYDRGDQISHGATWL